MRGKFPHGLKVPPQLAPNEILGRRSELAITPSQPGSDVRALRQIVLMFCGLDRLENGEDGYAVLFLFRHTAEKGRVAASVARFGSLRASAR